MTTRRELPRQFATRPFTVAEAMAAGIGRDRLERLDLARPFWGIRLPAASAARFDERCRAALLACRSDAFLRGPSAAKLWGIPLPFRLQRGSVIEVGLPSPARAVRRAGIVGRVCTIGDHEIALQSGMRAATPVRTWCDLAVELSVPELRTLVVLAGLPRPAVNATIRSPGGRFIARVDLFFAEYGEVLEYQGDHHRTDVVQWRRDRTRESELESLGLHVTEVTAADLARPRLLIERVARNLRRRGWEGSPRYSPWFPKEGPPMRGDDFRR